MDGSLDSEALQTCPHALSHELQFSHAPALPLHRMPDLDVQLQAHNLLRYLDEHRRQALGAQLLVHAQEVYLGHLHARRPHVHSCRHACDEAHQLAARAHAHPHMPVREEPWGMQRPAQELLGVFEPAMPERQRWSDDCKMSAPGFAGCRQKRLGGPGLASSA